MPTTNRPAKATVYVYDERNVKVSEAYPGHDNTQSIGGADYDLVKFKHDGAGRLQVRVDQQGDACTYGYDMANRLKEKQTRLHDGWTLNGDGLPSGTVKSLDSFEYDGADRIVSAERDRDITDDVYHNRCEIAYDDLGRKSSEKLLPKASQPSNSYEVGYEHDNENLLSKITFPDNADVDRTYTPRRLLDLVTYSGGGHNGKLLDDRTYDAAGRLWKCELGNDLLTEYKYRDDNNGKDDLVQEIRTYYLGANGTDEHDLRKFTYTYDDNKNKLEEEVTRGTGLWDYSFGTNVPAQYDDSDRLTNGFVRMATRCRIGFCLQLAIGAILVKQVKLLKTKPAPIRTCTN